MHLNNKWWYKMQIYFFRRELFNDNLNYNKCNANFKIDLLFTHLFYNWSITKFLYENIKILPYIPVSPSIRVVK